MAHLVAPDGAPLAYDAFEPQGTPIKAVVLWVCGWSDHRTRWRAPAERLSREGYAVYVLDQRGQGDSGGLQGHLSRFSQLLGDLQAFRRLARLRHAAPQVLLGHSFGALVVLRYLETQPSDVVAAAILSSPWLRTAQPAPRAKRVLARILADLWPTVRIATGMRASDLCRDSAVGVAYDDDPTVHHVMTPGAWREIQWAQRAVPFDAHRIESPMLFLLGGSDRITDPQAGRALADAQRIPGEVRWYADMYHELLNDPEAERVIGDVTAFLERNDL